MEMLETHLPQVLEDAQPILLQEGISLRPSPSALHKILPFRVPLE
jgi:hypothetical protein